MFDSFATQIACNLSHKFTSMIPSKSCLSQRFFLATPIIFDGFQTCEPPKLTQKNSSKMWKCVTPNLGTNVIPNRWIIVNQLILVSDLIADGGLYGCLWGKLTWILRFSSERPIWPLRVSTEKKTITKQNLPTFGIQRNNNLTVTFYVTLHLLISFIDSSPTWRLFLGFVRLLPNLRWRSRSRRLSRLQLQTRRRNLRKRRRTWKFLGLATNRSQRWPWRTTKPQKMVGSLGTQLFRHAVGVILERFLVLTQDFVVGWKLKKFKKVYGKNG